MYYMPVTTFCFRTSKKNDGTRKSWSDKWRIRKSIYPRRKFFQTVMDKDNNNILRFSRIQFF